MTLSATIHDAIRNQITDGIYGAGSLLPCSRALTAEPGVARSTVTVAWRRVINTTLSRPNKSLKYDVALGSLPLRKARKSG